MSENNNNKNWRSGLDELNLIPGEKFNGDQAWLALRARPVRSHGRRRFKFYWYAAAAMICTIIFSLLFNMTKRRPNPGFISAHKNAPSKLEIGRPADLNNYLAGNKKPGGIYTSAPVKLIIPGKKYKLNKAVDTVEPVLSKTLTPMVSAPSFSIDSITRFTALSAPKRKLKTVRLNEIETPGNETNNGLSQGKPFFPLQFSTRQVYSSNGSADSHGSENIIKIKLTFQN